VVGVATGQVLPWEQHRSGLAAGGRFADARVAMVMVTVPIAWCLEELEEEPLTVTQRAHRHR
jgi:hypothetical protein